MNNNACPCQQYHHLLDVVSAQGKGGPLGRLGIRLHRSLTARGNSRLSGGVPWLPDTQG